MREGKDHMKVRRVNDFGPTVIHPKFGHNSLAVGAAAVTAGIVMEFDMAAVLALGDGKAKGAGLAIHDGMGRFLLGLGERVGRGSLIPSKVENFLYLIFIHGILRPGRKD